jgi:hypothetical protein
VRRDPVELLVPPLGEAPEALKPVVKSKSTSAGFRIDLYSGDDTLNEVDGFSRTSLRIVTVEEPLFLACERSFRISLSLERTGQLFDPPVAQPDPPEGGFPQRALAHPVRAEEELSTNVLCGF